MLYNGTIEFEQGTSSIITETGDPIASAVEWQHPIPCNITIKKAEIKLYLGGEYKSINSIVICSENALNSFLFEDITRVRIHKGKQPSQIFQVQYIEHLPILKSIKFYL